MYDFSALTEIKEAQTKDDEDVEISVTEVGEPQQATIPIIKVQDYDSEDISRERKSVPFIDPNNENLPTDEDDKKFSNNDTSDQTAPENCSPDIQETLADIAQTFTSKLDSIRSSFTMSLDRNVASCLGKK